MKNTKYIFVFAVLFMALIGCSDDFVNVDSQDANSETFFNSEEDYQNALIAAYDMLQSTYLSVMLGEIASDNTLAGGESATDVVGIQQIDDMIHTPVNQQLRDVWNWMYAGVNRCNYIMEFENKTDFSGKNEVIAQTRFLRAYYYFELVKFFGDVPFAIDQRILFGDQFNIDRTPKETIYTQMEVDLMYAIDNLPAIQSETGRVTKGAAQAMLGKVYLFQDKFGPASQVLADLIDMNEGNYDLVMDYTTIFENNNENNEESVFEVQYTDVEGAGFGCFQCSEGNIAVGFNGIRNYNGPRYDSGFSFNVPTQDAYDAFDSDDPRLPVAILDIDAWATANNATFNTGFEHTGYYNQKYIARQGDSNIGDQNLTNPNNYRAIRFADVLLMAAEAFNRGNIDDGIARGYLNRVRTRAARLDITASGSALTDAIFQERRVELLGEGHRFFDLVRTGRAASRITGFVPGKHEVFPIPSIEIELAGNRWDQNPGY